MSNSKLEVIFCFLLVTLNTVVLLAAPVKSTTWNGSSWSNGVADWSKDFITITGDLSTTGGVSPGSITIEDGATLTLTGTTTTAIGNGNSLTMNGSSILTIEGSLEFSNGSFIDIGENASLSVTGDLVNKNNSENVVFNGSIGIGGDLDNGTGGLIEVNGDITVSGTVNNSSGAEISNPSGEGTLTAGTINNSGTIGDSVESNGTGTLPVELSFFEAKITEGIVIVSWATYTEINNDYFTVERSLDGENFSSIREIEGNGTTNSVFNYSIKDATAYVGIIYYRLTQVDFDGTETIYESILVDKNTSYQNTEAMIYPNPTNSNHFNIQMIASDQSNETAVGIYSSTGDLVFYHVYRSQFAKNEISINLPNIDPGVYHVKISHAGNEIVKKLVMR